MILQVLAASIFFAKSTHIIAVNQNIINFTEKNTETAVNKAIFDFGISTLRYQNLLTTFPLRAHSPLLRTHVISTTK